MFKILCFYGCNNWNECININNGVKEIALLISENYLINILKYISPVANKFICRTIDLLETVHVAQSLLNNEFGLPPTYLKLKMATKPR